MIRSVIGQPPMAHEHISVNKVNIGPVFFNMLVIKKTIVHAVTVRDDDSVFREHVHCSFRKTLKIIQLSLHLTYAHQHTVPTPSCYFFRARKERNMTDKRNKIDTGLMGVALSGTEK